MSQYALLGLATVGPYGVVFGRLHLHIFKIDVHTLTNLPTFSHSLLTRKKRFNKYSGIPANLMFCNYF